MRPWRQQFSLPALADANGLIRTIVSERYARVSDDPAAWWAMFCRAVERLNEDAAMAQVEAVAISAITRTQVVLDGARRVLGRATLWDDSAAEPLLPRLRAILAGHAELPAINAFHPAARLFRLALEQPDVARAAAAVLEPKDYLNLRLTGVCAIDRIASARLIATGGAALQAFGYADIIPQVFEPTAIVGRVQPGLPGALARLEGRPVIAMAHDTWASVIGVGALREGCAYNLSGTTEVLGVMARQPVPADGLLTVDWGGLHQIGGPSQVGGDTLVWLAALLGQELGRRSDEAAGRAARSPAVAVPALSPGRAGAVLGPQPARCLHWPASQPRSAGLRTRGAGGHRILQSPGAGPRGSGARRAGGGNPARRRRGSHIAAGTAGSHAVCGRARKHHRRQQPGATGD